MVIHTCNPSIVRQRQEDGELEASLAYVSKKLKKPKKQNQTSQQQQTVVLEENQVSR
jgi:uncharacterized coiled-coil protein SlyX